MRCGGFCCAVAVVLLTASVFARAEDARIRKKLIATGWDHPNAERLLQNGPQMDQQPFDGTVVDIEGKRDDGKPMRMAAAFSTEPWKKQWYQGSIEQLKACRLQRLTDNFILLGANPGDVDWFDDEGWTRVVEHWRIAAQIVKESGTKGILFDPEPYTPPHAQFRYSAQTGRGEHSFDEYYAQARLRGRQVMQAIAEECPRMTIFCYFMNSIASSAAGHADPRRILSGHGYGLYPAFIDGWLDAAPASITFVDGCESAYLYNSTEQFLESAVRMKGACQELVSPGNRAKYRAQVQVSFGIYLDAYWNPPGSPWFVDSRGGSRMDRLRANVSTALRCADEYVWIYGEKFRWWPTPNKRVREQSWPEALPGSDKAVRLARDPLDYARNQLQALGRQGSMVNLLKNGDFAAERPLGWSTWQEDSSKGAFAWDRETGAREKGSARATNVRGGCFIQGHPAGSGGHYVVRAMRRLRGKGEATIRVRWQTEDGKWVAEGQDVMVYADGSRESWVEMMGVAEVPQSASRIVILLGVNGQDSPDDSAWFDDVELFKLE